MRTWIRIAVSIVALSASLPMGAMGTALAQPEVAQLTKDDDWHFVWAPYLWAADTSGTITFGQVSGDLDLPFSSVLDQLKGAFTTHFEARRNRFGLVTDFSYISAAKGGVINVNLPQGNQLTGNLGLKIVWWENWAFVRAGNDKNAFDLFGGVRYNRLETAIDFNEAPEAGRTIDLDWLDPIVGARWLGGTDNVLVTARADVGGFGAGSDLTVNLVGGVTWMVRPRVGLVIDYRYMDVDYKNGPEIDPGFFGYEAKSQGVLLGVAFTF